MSRNPIVDLIITGARARGLDPNAVLAVARQEGLSGGVGDGGHAFGPFQVNDAGGVLTGRPGNHRKFAESPEGINWALDQIARVAKGKTGAAAINAIVRRFERPADPDGEVARAISSLQGRGSVALGSPVPSAGLTGAQNTRSPDPLLAGVLKANGMPDAISALLSSVPKPTPSLEAPGLAQPSFGPDGKVVFASGADRPGVHTNPAVVNFVSQISSLYGAPLTVGTGTNHNQHTVNGSVSDHWSGNAVDIPATGAKLIKLGQAALIAAGMPAAQAHKVKSYAGRVGGHQIIFNSNVPGYGDHRDHLHVSGVRR